MSHGIMVCDVPLYRDLTKVNVIAYLASKLVCVEKIEKLDMLLQLDQTYEFVITLAALDKVDVTKQVIAIKDQYLPNVPLVIIGHSADLINKLGNVLSPFDQISIVKFIANQLGWTPTDLMNKRIDQYIPIPVALIQYSPTALEDIYIKPKGQSDEYVLAVKSGDSFEIMKKNWLEMNLENVYISSIKRVTVITEITRLAVKKTREAIGSDSESMQLKVVGDNREILSESFSDLAQFEKLPVEIKAEMGVLAQETTVLINKILSRTSKVVNPALNDLVNTFKSEEKSYIPQLSFLSMYISLQLIKDEIWFHETVGEKIRYLHFFNNLGILPIYKKYPEFPKDKNILKYYQNLNAKEKELYRWHPKIISSLMAKIPGIPLGLDQLILQHHGNTTGDFDLSLIHEDVSLLAKYCYISELFAEFLLDSSSSIDEILKFEAIKYIRNRVTLRSYLKIVDGLEKIKI
ncbi:MAG: hypothetical protein QE271_12355 [Bacteriovoracaceae bacterium]|nr:hypothetical protein [Bacteriovoracaceae bacterium]